MGPFDPSDVPRKLRAFDDHSESTKASTADFDLVFAEEQADAEFDGNLLQLQQADEVAEVRVGKSRSTQVGMSMSL